MSRDARPRRRVHARFRLALVERLDLHERYRPRTNTWASSVAFADAARGLTRPSILRGAMLGRPVSARAVERLLARLGAS